MPRVEETEEGVAASDGHCVTHGCAVEGVLGVRRRFVNQSPSRSNLDGVAKAVAGLGLRESCHSVSQTIPSHMCHRCRHEGQAFSDRTQRSGFPPTLCVRHIVLNA